MLSLLKTEKTLDFTDRVKKRDGGEEKKAATTLPYSQKKNHTSIFAYLIAAFSH